MKKLLIYHNVLKRLAANVLPTFISKQYLALIFPLESSIF